METLRQWALLPDPANEAVAWLQSAARGDRALALISPRAFFDDYRVHVTRRDLQTLHMTNGSEIYVMTTVAGHSDQMTTNLRAPLLLNLDRRLGTQVITDDKQPLRHPVPVTAKSAHPSVAETIRRVA